MLEKDIFTIAKDFERKIDEISEKWFRKEINQKDAINILEGAKRGYEKAIPEDSRDKELLDWYEIFYDKIKCGNYCPYIGP